MSSNFTNYDSDVTSFSGMENISRAVAECSISTAEITYFDQTCQTTEKQHTEVQTDDDCRISAPEYDEVALLEFMRKMAPQVETELRRVNKYFGSDYAQKLTKDDEILTKKLFTLCNNEVFCDFKIRHLSWNCYSHKIAVTFDHKVDGKNSTPSSYISIYECDKNDEFKSKPKDNIEVDSQITTLKFHPSLSSVFVYTTEHSRLYWHDINENMESNSKNFIDLITSAIYLSWINIDSALYLAFAAVDCRLYLIHAAPAPDERTIYRIFVFEESLENDHARGLQCFDFSSLNTNKLAVALYGGLLVSCSIDLARCIDVSQHIYYPVVCSFECPNVIINYVRYSHFESDIFVTSASDQYLRVYTTNVTSPKYVIAIEYIPLVLEWSHLQENIIKSWSSDGELKFYNYRQCTMLKSLKFENRIDSVTSSIKGMKELIAIGNEENISIWQTSLFIS